MANVFGRAITDATLRQLPEWQDGKAITHLDRGNVARKWINNDGKKAEAIAYVERLKKNWGNRISTYCLIYNATGDGINLITHHDWYKSHLGSGPHPTRLENGQWGAFLHVKRAGAATGSFGAVVYRALNKDGVQCDFMTAWSNPWNGAKYDNTAYTEIRKSGHFSTNNVWNAIEQSLYDSTYFDTDAWNGCLSTATIEPREMANVFGRAITDATLRQLPEWQDGKEITHLDRGNVARKWINSDGKKAEAIAYVERLKKNWGNGISTYCLIYNATGDSINLITHRDWYKSHLGPGPHPTRLENGQWGAFLHVKRAGVATGSFGAVVYRALNKAGVQCDFMTAWSNPWNGAKYDNTAYTEIRKSGHFSTNNVWNEIEQSLYNSTYSNTDAWNGCFSTSTIEPRGTTVRFEAVFELA